MWSYTPRKIYHLLFIASKRKDREHYQNFYTSVLAAQGDGKEVKRVLASLERELE